MKTEILPDEIRYTARKTLSMSIDRFGRLVIHAPKGCKKSRIDGFIAEKDAWIRKQKARFARAAMPLPTEDLEGYCFPLLGKQTKILLTEGNRVGYDVEGNLLYVPAEQSRERLVAWLKENAKRIFTIVTQRKSEEMGVSYASITVTSARTRWGCCTGKNALRYTFRLLYCPREIVEYVVVHELAHIRHKDHSRLFWQEVERYMPDWKRRRKWLQDHGILLEVF